LWAGLRVFFPLFFSVFEIGHLLVLKSDFISNYVRFQISGRGEVRFEKQRGKSQKKPQIPQNKRKTAKKTRGNSVPMTVARGGSGAKAPPLAVRPRVSFEYVQLVWCPAKMRRCTIGFVMAWKCIQVICSVPRFLDSSSDVSLGMTSFRTISSEYLYFNTQKMLPSKYDPRTMILLLESHNSSRVTLFLTSPPVRDSFLGFKWLIVCWPSTWAEH